MQYVCVYIVLRREQNPFLLVQQPAAKTKYIGVGVINSTK
jgi:hypothetical protein